MGGPESLMEAAAGLVNVGHTVICFGVSGLNMAVTRVKTDTPN